MAAGIRSPNCAAPKATSTLVPTALGECALRRFVRAESDGDDEKRPRRLNTAGKHSDKRFGPQLG
eukprot:3166357-Alexandrium_andersonii.AAC.1